MGLLISIVFMKNNNHLIVNKMANKKNKVLNEINVPINVENAL
jgi:hypothetical protein